MQTGRAKEVSSIMRLGGGSMFRRKLWHSVGQLSINSLKGARKKTGIDTRAVFKE